MLTGSLSWDLESPYLFDHVEVATRGGVGDGCDDTKVVAIDRVHRRQSDRTYNKLNMILKFLMYKPRFFLSCSIPGLTYIYLLSS